MKKDDQKELYEAVAAAAEEANIYVLGLRFMVPQTKKFTLEYDSVEEVIAIAKKIEESGEAPLDELYISVKDGFGYPGSIYVYYEYETEMTGYELQRKRDRVFRTEVFSALYHALVEARGWKRTPVRSSYFAKYDDTNFFMEYQEGKLNKYVEFLSVYFSKSEDKNE